jgi:plastocyanin
VSRFTRGFLLAAAVVCTAACDGGESTPEPRRRVVEIRGFEYFPANLVVAPGDTVVWVNHDAVPHTATAVDAAWDSGSIASNQAGSWVVSGEGGDYTCAFHPAMKARISIAAAPD